MEYESLGLIYERAKLYTVKFNWQIADDLKSAMIKRNSGGKYLSWREADIAARQEIDLNNKFFIVGLSGGFLHEDIPQLKESIYLLRAAYNRGLVWVKTKRDQETLEKQKIGNEYLLSVYNKINDSGLKFWEEEKKQGFHQELLKPEYMTQNDFLIASRHGYYHMSPEKYAAIVKALDTPSSQSKKEVKSTEKNYSGKSSYDEKEKVKRSESTSAPKMVSLGSKKRRTTWKRG